MKHTTMIALAALVMAAGCTQTLDVAEIARRGAKDPTKPYFGDGTPIKDPPIIARSKGTLPANVVFNITPIVPAPPATRPQPTVIVSGNSPMTTITPTAGGGTQVVNYDFPAYCPYRPFAYPCSYYGY